MTDDELDTLEADERAKPTPDPRVLALIVEVRRLRDLLAESLRTGERLIALFAKQVTASAEQALEDIGRQQAALAVGQN